MRAHHMAISLICSTAFCLLQAMAAYNHVHLTELLASKNWEQRREAYWFAMKAEWSLRATAPEFLMNVIKRNHFVPKQTKVANDEDSKCTPRVVAIAILADWAWPEATSIFIENIVHPTVLFHPPGKIPRTKLYEITKPMNALIAFGKQVAPLIVKELATLDPGYQFNDASAERHYINARRTYLLVVLYKVVGYREAYRMLQAEAKRLQFTDRFSYANLINASNIVKNWER